MAVTKKVGKLVDQLYSLKLKIEEEGKEIKKIEAKRDALKKKYAEKEDEIFNSFSKQELEGASGTAASVSVKKKVFASVKDWNKLYAYISKTKSYDMLQRRVSDAAYRERLEAGKKVPGVEKFTKVTLSLTKKK